MVRIQNLEFAYRSARPIYSGINLDIKQGGICGLLGKNGVGKTTLLNLIGGLLRPASISSIEVMGHTPFERKVSFLQEVFLLPEEFKLPRTTVTGFAKRYGAFYPHFSFTELEELCREFEIDPSSKLHTMSYGQRKKAYIAFALACNTALLLLDEPTNGLDIPSKMTFRRMMARYADMERTIIISTHQVRDLEEILDSVIILDSQRVLLNSTVSELTERYTFGTVTPEQDALYTLSSIHGMLGICHRSQETPQSSLDIEMLFNAVNLNPSIFNDNEN
ncbi:MAG: ABC transporter ATP-binding protein [Rikenellaceae bacterium]